MIHFNEINQDMEEGQLLVAAILILEERTGKHVNDVFGEINEQAKKIFFLGGRVKLLPKDYDNE